jgi:diguanylate cyclase (GGDEF)-like protein
MLNLTIFTLLLVFLVLSLNRILSFSFSRVEAIYRRLKSDHDSLEKRNKQIKEERDSLEESVEKTIALYDITKDICKSLEEEKVFNAFKEKIQRYIKVGDCRLLRPDDDISKYANFTILPLNAYKKIIGFLAVSGIRPQDTDKFYILAQQFMLGIKRALLYKEVQELSITDSLTHVFTRRYFMERFAEELSRSKKFKHRFSFLMVDIDHFKDFNDRYGHLVGDAILRDVTKTIKDTIRQIDLIGRYGGEEISIILTETDKDQARFAAERIRRAIETKHIKAYDEDLKATISIGISTYPLDSGETKSLIEKADEALYMAKQAGRNRICLYQARQ